MRLIFVVILTFSVNILFGQTALDSVGHVDYNSLHNTVLNDVWGYEDETGKEYALVGAEDGFSVVDVSIPSSPSEIFWEAGMHSVWRDVKTWGDYFYVSTEALNGLLIVDGTGLPSSTNLSATYFDGDGVVDWESAHNLYVDELGYLYVFGANYDVGGVLIYDVFTDPLNPTLVGEVQGVYSHDGYVKNDKLYLAHISDGYFSIHDIADRSTPILLGSHTTPTTLSHNIWVSDDGNYAFTTDEVQGGYITSYDVSDPTNITELDRAKHNPDNNVIPHNAHVLNDYLITSYYTAGVIIHDIKHPNNVVEVAQYKTFPQENSTYDGCWGVYPFFNSGLIAASDRTEGLFLLSPTYQRAAYLEGEITEDGTSALLNSVDVSINGYNEENISNPQGEYACGTPLAGVYNVTYSKVGYFPQTISVNLIEDQITIQDVILVPIPTYPLLIRVFDQATNNPIPVSSIYLEASLISYAGITNGIGEEDVTLAYQEDYKIIVGKWGYKTKCETVSIDDQTGTLDVYLESGYFDDFTFDFGWTNSLTATTGQWERGVPEPTDTPLSPIEDVGFDCGNQLMITGNTTVVWGQEDDVDVGSSVLISPIFDLTGMTEPYLHCYDWYLNHYGSTPENDTVRYILNNGSTQVEILKYGGFHFGGWNERSLKLSDFLPITNTMQLRIEVTEYLEDHITEMAFDDFKIIEEAELSLSESNEESILVYPNPVDDQLFVEVNKPSDYSIVNLRGEMILNGKLSSSNNAIDTSKLENGIYLINVDGAILKFIKTN